MNYKSISDVTTLMNYGAGKLPADVDLIVGTSRYGMLLADIVSLKLNLPHTSLDAFLRNDKVTPANTAASSLARCWDAKKILVVDDVHNESKPIRKVATEMARLFSGKVITLIAFPEKAEVNQADHHLDVVDSPRVFEWNMMHDPLINNACLDIDGVLCLDPTVAENDDGEKYLQFLNNTLPLHIPSQPVAHLVTSRLEKYREQTEQWLERQGVRYGQLHMLNLPSAAERQRLRIHYRFKAEVYRSLPDSVLFIESEKAQAVGIMEATGKPVFCVETNRMYVPGMAFHPDDAQSRGGLLEKIRQLKYRLGLMLSRQASPTAATRIT
ncbi:phosphoribosyltransferase [Pseudomonas sp. gcc21]|uniref:phosphoribosyltransferase n=1 Tax=Pseudomonas sp. gcc21 TaxID=2726989 RepID=UPI0014513DCC|nr:phosphoribosyltransferase [Pseudomonas sp. gcc21]QJD57504.1 phosphoribosyltransferase [Pseudomonas sp. gcc21]